MKIVLQSKTNSFVLNGMEYQKGSLNVNYRVPNTLVIGGISADVSEVEADGEMFENIEDLQTWVSANLFYKGGGSGEGLQKATIQQAQNSEDVQAYVNPNVLNEYVSWFSQSLNIIDPSPYADPPTSDDMNVKYPNARVRTTVYLSNVGGGSLKYTKLNSTDWESTPYTIA